MTLDDDLRLMLASRAGAVAPLPDPMHGVEARARGIRRTRAALAMGASAVAVAVVAVAVPVLTDGGQDRTAPQFASPAPSVGVAPSRYALDPTRPWPFRGDPEPVAQGNTPVFAREWGARHGAQPAGLSFTPLFAQVYEPSGVAEVVYVATLRASGESFWGVVRAGESGPEFQLDTALAPGTLSLAAALPGDESGRLLVVAAPEVASLTYSPGAGQGFRELAPLAPGVVTGPLDGDAETDTYRLVNATGTEVFQGPAPDAVRTYRPANALDWGARGAVDRELEVRAVEGFATALGTTPAKVGHSLLFTGSNDPGQSYVVLQAWVDGPAYSFGWIETAGRESEPVLQPAIAADKEAVTILVTGIPGRTSDKLIVVPAPGTGQVLYQPSSGAGFTPVADVPGGDGVVLVDRALGTDSDSLRLLDGDGRQTFEGTVFDLLCGLKGCG